MQQMIRIALAATVVYLVPAARAVAQDYTVVVNDAVPGTTISPYELARIFERRAIWWPNRLAVDPVDQTASAPLRATFSREILGKTVAQAQAYWQTQVFSGRGLPPVELPGDAEVLQYVLAHQGAVGYVSTAAKLPDGVHRLRVTS